MQAMDAAKALAEALRETPEYTEYARLKEEINADEGIKSLVNEFKRLQTSMQMRALAGQTPDSGEAQRFQSLNMLLFADQRTSGYLMAELRLQRLMAQIFETLTRAVGMDVPLPV